MNHERLGSDHNEVCTVQGERCPCFTLHRSHDQILISVVLHALAHGYDMIGISFLRIDQVLPLSSIRSLVVGGEPWLTGWTREGMECAGGLTHRG